MLSADAHIVGAFEWKKVSGGTRDSALEMILGPPSPCFVEINDAVSALMQDRGDPREVVFRWQYAPDQVPEGAVVYNFDYPEVHFSLGQMVAVTERASEVWDFSAIGARAWKMVGVRAKHVPVGYHPSMSRFQRLPPEKRDVDVAFVGSLNERRLRVLKTLQSKGLTVYISGDDRAARDDLLARCRCSINMLYYERGVYPMLRAAHLLSNGVPYVGEISTECEQDPYHAEFVPYEGLVDAVERVVREARELEFARWAPLTLPV